MKTSGDKDDIDIIRKILAGEKNAYAELVRKYQTKVKGYCLNMLSNPTDAEDSAQEIFIKAYKALVNFNQDSTFSTWLYRITANHCKDKLRQHRKKKPFRLMNGAKENQQKPKTSFLTKLPYP